MSLAGSLLLVSLSIACGARAANESTTGAANTESELTVPATPARKEKSATEGSKRAPSSEQEPSNVGANDGANRLGALLVRGGLNAFLHDHGGPGASIGGVSLEVDNTGTTAVGLSVTRVEWLQAHCRSETWDSATPLESGFIHLDDVVLNVPLGSSVSLSAGPHKLYISWPVFSAYNACDRFAARVHLRTTAGELIFEAPIEVTREEPLRPGQLP